MRGRSCQWECTTETRGVVWFWLIFVFFIQENILGVHLSNIKVRVTGRDYNYKREKRHRSSRVIMSVFPAAGRKRTGKQRNTFHFCFAGKIIPVSRSRANCIRPAAKRSSSSYKSLAKRQMMIRESGISRSKIWMNFEIEELSSLTGGSIVQDLILETRNEMLKETVNRSESMQICSMWNLKWSLLNKEIIWVIWTGAETPVKGSDNDFMNFDKGYQRKRK